LEELILRICLDVVPIEGVAFKHSRGYDTIEKGLSSEARREAFRFSFRGAGRTSFLRFPGRETRDFFYTTW
jgi:hypothetical protein